MDSASNEINKLAQKIRKFKSNIKPIDSNMIRKMQDVINNVMTLPTESELGYNGFESGIFPLPKQPKVLAKQKNQTYQKNQGHQSTQAMAMDIFYLKKKYQKEG